LPCSPANYFCLGNYNIPTAWKVTTCAAGSYLSSPPSTTADGVCSPCGITNYCAGGTVSRTICPAGWFCSTDGATKTQCPPGSYCGEGSTTQTNCGAGYYSATLGAASISTCLACDAGKFAPTTGSTACTLCGIGSYSGGVAFSRCTDCTDLLNYQDFQGQIACKPCTTTTCAAGTSTQICTKYTDKSCTSCTPIANCKYSGNLCTDAISGKPACACAAGYQMAAAAPYICLQCPYGTFKSIESSTPCTPWTDRSSCAFTTLGTRITDSACVVFPLPPDNAVAVSDGWRCNAGYEKAL
jgi:syndecan 4